MGILANILFPKKCVHCGRAGSYLCDACFAEIGFLTAQHCPACKQSSLGGIYAHGCSRKRSDLDQLLSVVWYRGPMASVIKAIKFPPYVVDVHQVIKDLIIRGVAKEDFYTQGRVWLVPVPLSRERFRERGFNQAEKIANDLSGIIGGTIVNGLIRTRNTVPQSTLPVSMLRQENTQHAFGVNEKIWEINDTDTVVIIDDVYTTGATINACAKVIRKALPKVRVIGFTVARG